VGLNSSLSVERLIIPYHVNRAPETTGKITTLP